MSNYITMTLCKHHALLNFNSCFTTISMKFVSEYTQFLISKFWASFSLSR